jgi:hypothetical protein
MLHLRDRRHFSCFAPRTVGLIALAGLSLAAASAIAQDSNVPAGDNDENLPVVQPRGQAAAHEAPQELEPALVFTVVPEPVGARRLPQAKNHIAAVPNIAALQQAVVGGKFILNVAPDLDLRMTVTLVDRRPDGTFSIRGTLDRIPGTSVMMAVQEDALACDITAAPVNLHYKTRYVRDGVHLVCEMDDNLYAPCAPRPQDDGSLPAVEENVPEPWEVDLSGEQIDVTQNPFDTRGSCSPTVVFDAMIVYSDTARLDAGGTTAIQAECQLAIDRSNESYENSPVSARMRLVRRYEVAYNEVGIYDDHLDRLTGTNGQGGSGIWPGIRTNRDTFNADFCTLWVADGDACGLAWCTSGTTRAYSVVTWSCAAGNLSHPHEIGHNQGCDHDPGNSGAGCAALVDSFGHRFNGTDGVQYRTVMSYAPGIRIPYFSNTGQTYQGTATGIVGRDNEGTIEARKDTCEAFETTRWDIFVDASYSNFPIPGIGTNAFPYSVLSTGVTAVDDYVTGASEYPNLYLKSDFTTYTGTINKPMTILPCGGAKDLGS